MATCETCKANKVCDHNKYGFENCNNYISADVLEVVRCKDCAHKGSAFCMAGDFPLTKENENCYCSYGERTPKERGADE